MADRSLTTVTMRRRIVVAKRCGNEYVVSDSSERHPPLLNHGGQRMAFHRVVDTVLGPGSDIWVYTTLHTFACQILFIFGRSYGSPFPCIIAPLSNASLCAFACAFAFACRQQQ